MGLQEVTAKSTARKGAVSVVDKAGESLPETKDPGPPVKRRHLEGFAYYFVIVPCWIIASIAVLLFVDAVERYIFGDD